jgi:hypothetical protein
LFVLWCLTPLSTIFQLYRGGHFYWWRKPPTCRKSLTNFITLQSKIYGVFSFIVLVQLFVCILLSQL